MSKIKHRLSLAIAALLVSAFWFLFVHFTPEMNWPVADLLELNQDVRVYADYEGADTPLTLPQDYLDHWLEPWDSALPLIPKFSRPNGFDRFGRRHLRAVRDAIYAEQNAPAYPSTVWDAVAVRAAPLRIWPTDLPMYGNPAKDPTFGEPFDYAQDSMLKKNSPVKVVHSSLSGEWLLTVSSDGGGSEALRWVKADAVRPIDSSLKEGYKEFAVTPDGTLYHLTEAPADAEPWPIPATPRNIARLAKAMSGPYGWGGRGGDRDCSLLMRDLFAAFGTWLPRNSNFQAQHFPGIDLSGLTPAQKLEAIERHGRPFASMIHLPGHIMLYIGNGKVYHNIWGLRYRDRFWRIRRLVIGRAVVTTLTPGKDIPGITSTLLDRVDRLAVIEDVRSCPAGIEPSR